MSNSAPLIFAVASILVLSIDCCHTKRVRLQEELLKDDNYENIHRVAIEDQVNYYQPAQQSLHTRASKNLDGMYDFCLDELQLGFKQKWHSSDLQSRCKNNHDERSANFYRMPVPSAFNDVASNKRVHNYIGWLWYQTIVDNYGPLFAGQKHGRNHRYIQFESANYLAIVWVQKLPVDGRRQEDARLVGSHVGGHLPFIVNLTEALGVNEAAAPFRLTIAVSNNLTSETIPSGSLLDLSKQVGRPFSQFKPDFDFFHFAGLIGSVNLIQLPEIHIGEVRQTRLRFNPDHCTGRQVGSCEHLAEFEVHPSTSMNRGWMRYPSSSSSQCNYSLELWFKHEQLIASKEVLGEDCEQGAVIGIPFNDSMIWEPANGRVDYFAPNLRAKISLSTTSGSTDRYEFPVGFRAHFEDQLYQRARQLQGFGMHQEQLFSGRTMGQSAIMKDIYLLKQWGANVIRTSHYPYSREFLDACQENGIPVIAECSAVGVKSFSEQKLMLHKQLLREMMQRDHNNAAIIGWSVANEPQSQLRGARPYFESLLKFCREDLYNHTWGSDRFLTAAIAQSHEADTVGHLLDVIMVNRYYGWYDWTGVLEAIELPLVESLRGWARKHPHKRLLISEFGADTVAGMHSLYDELFSEEFQASLVAEHERIFDKLFDEANQLGNDTCDARQAMNFMGSMLWNFADFSTDISLLRVGGNKKGIFTQDRRPKLAAHELRKIYLARLTTH